MSNMGIQIKSILQNYQDDRDIAFQLAVMALRYLGEKGSDDEVWETAHSYSEAHAIDTERLEKIFDLSKDIILNYGVKKSIV